MATNCDNAAIAAVEGQIASTPYPYFSRIKFYAPRSGNDGGPYTYTIDAGRKARAFSYGKTQSKVSAGFTAVDGLATEADTNIIAPGSTISGESVAIFGIFLQLLPGSMHRNDADGQGPGRVRFPDARLLAALLQCVDVSLSLNGGAQAKPLGSLSMIPGAGGMMGASPDLSGPVDLGAVNQQPFAANGWPVRSNHFKLPEGLTWRPNGQPDGALEIIFNVSRPISIPSGTPEVPASDVAANNDPGNVATAEQAYTYPTELVCEFIVGLVGRVVSGRSRMI